MKQLQLPTINPDEIIAYRSVAVVTTRMLADFYETDRKQILNNFNRNKDRFIERKHYFKIEGEERKEWHFLSSKGGQKIDSRGRNLLLWTERASQRMGKSVVVEVGESENTCPKCGGKVQSIGKGSYFCLDCDWDNLEPRKQG